MFLAPVILGFHGCDREIGERVLAGEDMLPSRNEYDWIGEGIYFWENDPLRALRWAEFIQKRPHLFRTKVKDPFVIGAIIQLGNCLDLTNSDSLTRIGLAYSEIVEFWRASGMPLPENKPGFQGDEDLVQRHLDCAVINGLHFLREQKGLTPYTTVRGPFTEGKPLYPGSKIMAKTHVQVAVRDTSAIRGYFRVKEIT